MGKQTAIEWTDATWNPWRGCKKVSPGCKNCYMYREQKRYGKNPMEIVRAAHATFTAPLKWKEPKRVFTCSWSDFFIEEADEWREEAWSIIRQTPHLTYQVLTKRPDLIKDRLPQDWGEGYPNVWLGVSVENQDYMGRAMKLADLPAKVRFISYEPALGPLDFDVLEEEGDSYGDGAIYYNILSGIRWMRGGWGKALQEKGRIHWLISGGESGATPRPAELDWFRSVRDQCLTEDVSYFHKQNGGTHKVNGSYGGHLLDGMEYRQMPFELFKTASQLLTLSSDHEKEP